MSKEETKELDLPTAEQMDEYRADTAEHIGKVQSWMREAVKQLDEQLNVHDQSKFSDEESNIYAVVTPMFKGVEYGTKEHKAVGDLLGPAWEHHVENNAHHPGHFSNGVNGMNLMLIIEMLCDWKAASERNPNQVFADSCKINCEKYGLDEQLTEIVMNTARSLGML